MIALLKLMLFMDLFGAPAAEAWGAQWPKDANGNLMSCQYTTVLSDHKNGWPAACTGLVSAGDGTFTEDSCRAKCGGTTKCNVWQLTTSDECLVSTNYYSAVNCWSGGTTVKGGQRLQHGEVKVVKKLTNVKYTGLNVLGHFYTTNDKEQAIQRCRKQCYSDVTCGVWQFDKDTGCEVQNANNKPVPGESPTVMSPPAYEIGEVIQHSCIPPPSVGDDGSSDNTSLPLIIICVLVVLIIALLLIYFCCFHESNEKKTSKSKTRSVKVRPAKDQPRDQLLAQSVAVPRPMPVMATYAATPMATPAYQMVATTPAVASQAMVPMLPRGPVVQPLASSLAVVGPAPVLTT